MLLLFLHFKLILGYVANYVETELIIDIFDHQLAFVQIRGSVPVYWSQKGYKYRPPLTIDKPLGESLPVFEKHMNLLFEDYGKPVTVVNLVNQAGRELCLAQSFLEVSTMLLKGYYNRDFSIFLKWIHLTCVMFLSIFIIIVAL